MPLTKVFISGDYVEIYEYEKTPSDKIRYASRKRKKRSSRGAHVLLERSLGNLKRTRRSFVRLVRANLVGDDPPTLLTLTIYPICGIVQASQLFTEFVARLRRYQRAPFRYIAVPEFQRRGAVHFHALFWGLDHGITRNERHDRYLQNVWQYGYVDCLPTDGSPRLANYLAKYMSKAMSDLRLCGKRAYYTSRRLLRSVLLRSKASLSYLAQEGGYAELSTAKPLREFSSMTQWLGRMNYQLYKLEPHASNPYSTQGDHEQDFRQMGDDPHSQSPDGGDGCSVLHS